MERKVISLIILTCINNIFGAEGSAVTDQFTAREISGDMLSVHVGLYENYRNQELAEYVDGLVPDFAHIFTTQMAKDSHKKMIFKNGQLVGIIAVRESELNGLSRAHVTLMAPVKLEKFTDLVEGVKNLYSSSGISLGVHAYNHNDIGFFAEHGFNEIFNQYGQPFLIRRRQTVLRRTPDLTRGLARRQSQSRLTTRASI